jgi:hypothetical protein
MIAAILGSLAELEFSGASNQNGIQLQRVRSCPSRVRACVGTLRADNAFSEWNALESLATQVYFGPSSSLAQVSPAPCRSDSRGPPIEANAAQAPKGIVVWRPMALVLPAAEIRKPDAHIQRPRTTLPMPWGTRMDYGELNTLRAMGSGATSDLALNASGCHACARLQACVRSSAHSRGELSRHQGYCGWLAE